jgi:hypothetical protein
MNKVLSDLEDSITLLDEPNDFNGRVKELIELCAHELEGIDKSIVIDNLQKVDQILTDSYTSILSIDLSGDELIDAIFLAKKGRFSPGILCHALMSHENDHGIDLSIERVLILYMLSQLTEVLRLIKKANNSNSTRNNTSNAVIDMASTGKNRPLKDQWLQKATDFLFNAMDARRLYERHLVGEVLNIRAQKPEEMAQEIHGSIQRSEPIRALLIRAYTEEGAPKNNKFLTYEKLKSYDDENILSHMNDNYSEEKNAEFIFNINGKSKPASLDNLKNRMTRIRKIKH